MSVYVLDTDILSLWQHSHLAVSQHVLAHTVITVQEQLDGWHSHLARAKDRKKFFSLKEEEDRLDCNDHRDANERSYLRSVNKRFQPTGFRLLFLLLRLACHGSL